MTEEKKITKTLQSDRVTFTIHRKPECLIEYRVKTSPEIVKKTRAEAIKSVSKEISVPGFRKGRAPDYLVLKKFSNHVDNQWEKEVADVTFNECQKLAQIPLLSDDAKVNFNIEKQSIEDGAEITFTFETEPAVPTIDLHGVKIEEVQREIIDEKKIDNALKRIQTYFVRWEKISHREAKEGDFAIINVDIIEKESRKNILSNARFEISKKKMVDWMYEMVIGMKVGEGKEGVSQPNDDTTPDEKKNFPPKEVYLTLCGIEQGNYPPIDDTLAQKIGLDNQKKLKEKLIILLNAQADETVQKNYRKQITSYLLKHYRFAIPKTVLEKESHFRIKQLVQEIHFQQDLMKMDEEAKKKMVHEIQLQGEKALRLFYISRKIIQENNIIINTDEINQGVSTPLEAILSDQSDLYNPQEESRKQKEMVASRLILSKAQDFLISKATIVPLKSIKNQDDCGQIEKKQE